MEELLLARLAASTGLVALVGTRMNWGSREQAAALPAVTLNKVSGGPLYADEGEVGLDEMRVQIDIWAHSFTDATDTAREVRAQISGYHDDDFRYISLDVVRDMREGGGNQAQYEFRVSMDFIVLSGSV